MSVKLIDNTAFYGYRVRRVVHGTLYQEYFSLKPQGKRLTKVEARQVHQKAQQRDLALVDLKEALNRNNLRQRCFDAKGLIRGIRFRPEYTQRGRVLASKYYCHMISERTQSREQISATINAHGDREAWCIVVDFYAHHRKIKRDTPLYKSLLKARLRTKRAASGN